MVNDYRRANSYNTKKRLCNKKLNCYNRLINIMQREPVKLNSFPNFMDLNWVSVILLEIRTDSESRNGFERRLANIITSRA